MTSAAAGIAKEGFKVFTYSITPFATFRCLEQIRNDICYHNLNVTVVGVGAGYGYGPLGATHHALEDVAALWSLPNMKVFSPADIAQTEWSFNEIWSHGGPNYLRLGKGGEGALADLPRECAEGAFEYRGGSDVTLLCVGHILDEVLRTSEMLKSEGLSAQVISVPQLKPFPGRDLINLIKSKYIFAIEELNPYGGFSAQFAKLLLESGKDISLFRSVSVQDQFAKTVGSMKFQRHLNQMDSKNLTNFVTKNLSRNSG
jgi:transketolase